MRLSYSGESFSQVFFFKNCYYNQTRKCNYVLKFTKMSVIIALNIKKMKETQYYGKICNQKRCFGNKV